ncbi:MAG: NADH-quinone oxidoreductase subunit NuoE [Acidobacteriota bacterium]|nr:NADH-quinone oxidoreductase subunit NuoE [Acidobacteriota bacterium]
MNGTLSQALKDRIAGLAAGYPEPAAGLLPVLHLVQAEMGWIPPEAEREVAEILGLRSIQVREAVTFYSLFRHRPGGRHHVRVCRALSCTLRGSEPVWRRLRERLGIRSGETTPDGRISLEEVECLGNCDNAPCVLIDFEEHARVTPDEIDRILEGLD